MKNKLLSVSVTVIFINLCLAVLQRSDRVKDFIPLVSTFSRKRLTAYDFYLLVVILALKVLYTYFGISLSKIFALPHCLYPHNIWEIIFMAVSGILSHFIIWPLLYQVFFLPIIVLKDAQQPIRKTALMLIPLLWLFVITILNTSYNPTRQPKTSVMPQPPTW